MPAKAGIQGRGGALVSGGIHTLPSTSLGGIHTLPSTPWGGRHSLPSCPRRRASRVWRGTPLGRHPHPPSTSLAKHRYPPSTSLARHPYPAFDPFGEAATAYRHARGGGHPGSGGALLSGGIHTLRRPPWGVIHTLPSTPSWRPPQPTVMPAKAGIQGLAGHSSREVSTPSVNLLGEASIPPVNLLGEASISCLRPLRGGRHSLPSCPRRRASSGLGGTRLGRQQSSRSGTLQFITEIS